MIYDCFLYYDEDMLLEIRLNTLADVVDRFVIVESTHT
ncbi:benzoate transporter, partial [Enterobacter asburiae]|nr:benzoate transporter [Enterobacter asburiae]